MDFDSGGAERRDLAHHMLDMMQQSGGVGLAANQIGLPVRCFAMSHAGVVKVVFNPVITPRGASRGTSREGCLSFPGEQVTVKRYKRIVVEGFHWDGQPLRLKLSGLLAYIAQHEVDHLNGITMLGRAKSQKSGGR